MTAAVQRGPQPAPQIAPEPVLPAGNGVPDDVGDITCAGCGLLFANIPAHDLHRSGGRCVDPIAAGLRVAKKIALTWEVAPRAVTDPRCAEDD